MKKFLCILTCFLGLCGLHAQSPYTVQTVPNDHLKNAFDYVTNPDGIISPEAEQKINSIIASIEDSTTAQIAVVLLKSIGSDDIDDFGTRLFSSWGIGKDKKDNGLMFLLVYDQQQMIFRTGYGMEGVLPDVILSRIIRNDISPLLKQGDFDSGITAGIAKVCDYLKNPEILQEIKQQDQADQAKQTEDVKRIIQIYLVISLIIFLFFVLFLISVIRSKRTNYKKYLSLNAVKGGVIGFALVFPATMILFTILFFIFKTRLRNKPISCSKCGNRMHKLSESQEDAYLNQSQQKEESIHSMDYDVWLCNSCGNKEILPYNKASMYTVCPYCQTKTYYLSDDYTVKRATSISSGQGQRVYSCKNCGKKDFKPYIIPMIIIASGGRNGRGGGFSGGGFSGGSWGGGGTGGGGARGGW